MRKQCEMVNNAFRNRVKEVKDAKHKLETLLAMVSHRGQSVKKWKHGAWVICYLFPIPVGCTYLPHFHFCSLLCKSNFRFFFSQLCVCATTEINFWSHSFNLNVAVAISKVRIFLMIFSCMRLL